MSIVLVIILQAIIFGFFSAFVAKEKNRDVTSWFMLGFLFSFIALIALVAIPKNDDTQKTQAQPVNISLNKKEKLKISLILIALFVIILLTFLLSISPKN